MLKFKFKGYGKRAAVAVFRRARLSVEELLNSLRSVDGTDFQLLNLEAVAGKEHVYFAILNVLHAFKLKKNISKNLGMELLLYASAQRQIKTAIERVGVKEGRPVVLVAIGPDDKGVENFMVKASRFFEGKMENSGLEEWDKEKIKRLKEIFEISEEEMEALGEDPPFEAVKKLIIERMALLSVRGS